MLAGLFGAALLLASGCASNRSADSAAVQEPPPLQEVPAAVEAGAPQTQAEVGAEADQPAAAEGQAAGEEPLTEEEKDRLERVNRAVFAFNSGVDRGMLKPVAVGYDRIVPGPVRRRVNNFFHWLREPGNAVNNGLQGDLKGVFTSLSRFLINGTVGLAGLFDPATRMRIYRDYTGFDDTLAKWGMKTGTYIVVPFRGPTDVRYLLGLMGDAMLTPQFFIEPTSVALGLTLLNSVDTRAELLPLERAIIGDPYVFMREAHTSSRQNSNDKNSDEEGDDEFGFGDDEFDL